MKRTGPFCLIWSSLVMRVKILCIDAAASISFWASFMISNKEKKSVLCSTAFKREKFKVLNRWKKDNQKKTKQNTRKSLALIRKSLTYRIKKLSFALGENRPSHWSQHGGVGFFKAGESWPRTTQGQFRISANYFQPSIFLELLSVKLPLTSVENQQLEKLLLKTPETLANF